MPAELPGYYYDNERNRYFKIQANHIAPSGADYSRQAVNAQRTIKEAQHRYEVSRQTKKAATVSRSLVLQHPLFSFERRLGNLRTRPGSLVAEYYAAGLTGQTAVCTHERGRKGAVTVDWGPKFAQKFTIGSSGELVAPITYAHKIYGRQAGRHHVNGDKPHVVDGVGIALLPRLSSPDLTHVQQEDNSLLGHRQDYDHDHHTDHDTGHDEDEPWLDVDAGQANDQRGLSGYLYNYNRHQLIFNPTVSADCIIPAGPGAVIWVGEDPYYKTSRLVRMPYECDPLTTDPNQHQSFGYESQHRCSALATYGVPYRILDMAISPSRKWAALATSDGVSLFRNDRGQEHGFARTGISGEQMVVAFKDENTVMSGSRSGKVMLCDIRMRSLDSDPSTVLRIQHSSAVSGLAVLPPEGGHRVLVNGLQDMKLYDLRYAPPPAPSASTPKPKFANARSRSKSKSKHHAKAAATRTEHTPASLTFNVPPLRRQNRYGLGFAYDPELNVVLSASTDNLHTHRVGIWSASTGQLLRSPLNDYEFKAPVTCIMVERVRDGPKSILLATDGGIMEWTAQGRKFEQDRDWPFC
ncbi:hypothetical protein RBB50_009516 [Rhinocladiella similis]